MNIDGVRSLLLAVELGSFSAAAERLGVPPSTVSRRAADVEEDIGRRVLVRTGRGVRAAAEADVSLNLLRDLLVAADACYAPPAQLTRLRVTSTVEVSISLLPPLLPEFHEAFPNVVVEVRGDDRAIGLIEGDFDLAIRAGLLADTSYLARRFPSRRFPVVATPALAARIETVDALAATPTVEVVGPGPELRGRWRGEPFSVRSPAVARLDSFTAALPLVLAGQAYAAFPIHLVEEHLLQGRLAEITAARLDEVPVHALYPRRHRTQEPLLAFLSLIEAALAGPG